MKSPAKLIFETILVLAAALALAIAPLAAEACPAGVDPEAVFSEFDSDGNGILTRAEFDAGREGRHAEMAKQGRSMSGMNKAPAFADFDTDGDESLTLDEFVAGHAAHMKAMQKEHAGHGKGMHERRHGRKNRGQPHSFDEIDLDGNGCIDEAELNAHHGVMEGA